MFVAAGVAVLLFATLRVSGGRAPAPDARIIEVSSNPDRWAFDPAQLSVVAGTAVRWRNDGDHPHTVTADDGSFDSVVIKPGSAWTHRFERPGDYRYHCRPHPWMRGIVRVAE